MNKRLLSLLLALLMLVSLVPTAAFAAVADDDDVVIEAPVSLDDDLPQSAPIVPDEDAPAALAEGENPDWCRPTDGTTVTVKTLDADGNENNDCGESGANFTPDSVLSANYGWDYVGGTKNGPRWLSTSIKGGTHILQVDLGAVRRVSSIHLYWFNNNFTGLDVDVSPTADGNDWVNVRTQDSRVLSLLQRLSFAEQDVRRIRITMKNADDQGFSTDGDGYYDVSLYRVEAYTTEPTIDDTVTATPPGDDVNMAEIKKFGHVAEPSGTPACSSGQSRVDDSIYIRASASSWVTTDSGHPVSTTRAGLAFDGDPSTAWTSRADDAQPWIIVNLGTNRNVKGIKLNFGGSNVTNFKIDGTTNPQGESWQTLYEKTDGEAIEAPIATNLASQAPVTFVRLTVTGHTAGTSVVLKEMGIYANDQTPDSADPFEPTTDLLNATPDGNLCRPRYCDPADTATTVTATASSNETDSFTPDKVLDGDTSTKSSRWSSANNTAAQWLKIDLGKTRAIGMVKLYWERTNVTAYELQASQDGEDWSRVLRSCTDRIPQATESIKLATPIAARYLRINVTGHDDQGAATYKNVALYEVEVYKSESSVVLTPSEVAESITFKVEDGKLLPDVVPDGYEVTSYAANLEQVVGGEDGRTVFTPLVDTVVDVDVTVRRTVTDTSGSSRGDHPVRVTIPGEHPSSDGANEKPAVIPELMEWYSSAAQSGQKFTLSQSSKLIHRYGRDGSFDDVAKELDADIQDLFGLDPLTHEHSKTTFAEIEAAAQPGDIVIYNVEPNGTLANTAKVAGFDEETYRIEITDKVIIYATDATGAYWATRTLLQALKLSGDMTVAQGTIRDYPEFEVRGFVLDVGRKPMSMDMLYQITKNMAWYKLNDFHVHLNDNLIAMEDYKTEGESWNDPEIYKRADAAYSAFRLESDIQEEPGALPLTARDYHYTKAEYKKFVEDSAKLGVDIVSEIDVPAHAKAITDAFPSLQLFGYRGSNPTAQQHPYNDHLDLSTPEKHEASVAKTKEIFDEYLDFGIFGNYIHFGADEYYASGTPYRRYVKDMINYLKEKKTTSMPGLTIRQWGSLSQMSSTEPGLTDQDFISTNLAEGVQMNLWNTGWANPNQMYNLGYDLINTVDYDLYIVPAAGYYADYLPHSIYNNWTPNKFSNTWLPASSDQVIGAAYAIWNDCIDTRANGISEEEVFDRFFDILPYLSVKMWGEGAELDRTLTEQEANAEIVGLAPRTNPYYEPAETDHFSYDFTDATDKSGNGHDLELTNAAVDPVKHLLMLNGGESYAETGLDRLGWGSQLTFKVFKLAGGGEPQVIFEGDHAYGEFNILALPVEGKDNVWKLGFSRELYDYEFDVELPVGQWVRLTLTNAKQSTKLSVDGNAPVSAVGKFVSKPNSNNPFRGNTGITNSSFEFPVARIGSKTNAFVGYVASVSTSTPIEVPDSFLTATAPSFNNDGLPSYAIDGKPDTIYHSNYNSPVETNGPRTDDLNETNRYIQLDLASPATVTGLKYLPRQNLGNGTIRSYKVTVSTDGQTYKQVSSDTWTHSAPTAFKDAANFTPTSGVTSVRLYGLTTEGNFLTAAEIQLVYGEGSVVLSDDTAQITLGEVTWGETEATVELAVALKSTGYVLTEGTDYTVAYTNNTAAGTATVTVTGTGNYTGTLSAPFTVPAKPVVYNLSSAVVTFPEASYPLVDGKAEPKPEVKVGGVTLREGLDYTLTYANNTAIGEATVTVAAIAPNTGSKTAAFQVAAPLVKTDLSGAVVTTSRTSYPYTGSPIEAPVTVVLDGVTLVKDTDYTVSYSHNTAIGEATVTVTGIGKYEGTASATFQIEDVTDRIDLTDEQNHVEVTFAQESYALSGGKAEPKPTVKVNGITLEERVDYTLSYTNNTTAGSGVVIVHGIGAYHGDVSATFTITGGGGSSRPSSGSSSSGGSSTTTKQEDGASVTIKTDASGAKTAEATYPDGAKVTADIPVSGLVTATVTVPKDKDSVTVTIPTREEPTLGQVAVIIHPDGTEEIIKTSVPNKDGLEITLDANATIQIVDNTKAFVDVAEDNWASDAITFVTSREIFNGTGSNTFSPTDDMSRAMVCTVLANLEGVDTKGGATWYDKAVDWAQTSGVSDGSNPNAIVTREQLAAMLYRYAGSPEVELAELDFTDANKVSDWASQAIAWAVQAGLLKGRNGTELAPQATATRAEVATIFQRYLNLRK